MGLPKVLLVDDNKDLHTTIEMGLEGEADLLSALTLESARELFTANPDIQIIVMDGCLNSAPGAVQTPETLPLIHEFRRTFRGPMIAASDFDSFREVMVLAGCDRECEKVRLLKELRFMLAERP